MPNLAQQLNSVCQRYGARSARRTGADAWSHGRLRPEAGRWPGAGSEAPPVRPEPSAQTRLARLETVLFLAREPLSSRKLSQLADLADGTEARTLVKTLNQRYDQAGRAFRVEQVAGGYQLLTRQQFASWLRRLDHTPAEIRLSAPALETLAVVAYRQPVLRADIEAIRGVACGEILRQLMERDLVRISGRSEELGRPYLYSTTKRFLMVFGLRNLDQLPRADLLRNLATRNKTQPSEIHTGQKVEQNPPTSGEGP